MTDEELDALFAALPGADPPAPIQARVLRDAGVPEARVHALVPTVGTVVPLPRPRPARAWFLAGTTALALAASALLAFRSAPAPVGDPAELVPRGVGAPVPATLEVRVAVKHDGRVDRLAQGRACEAGDTLLFRVSAPEPVELTLRREQDLLWHGSVPAGESDLPVGYELEAGEAPARFVVEGGGASASFSLPAVQP